MVNGPSGDSLCSSEAASLPVTRQVCVMMESRVSCSGRLELSTARISRRPSATVRRRSASSCLARSSSNRRAFSAARPTCRPMATNRADSSGSSDRGARLLMTRAPSNRPLAVTGTADHQFQAFLPDLVFQLSFRILGQRPDNRLLQVDLLAGERGLQRHPGGAGNEPLRQSPVGHEHQGLGLLFQPVGRPRFHAGGFHRLLQRGFHDLAEVQRSAHHGGQRVEHRQLPRALLHAPFQVLVGLLQLRLGPLALADVHVGADDAQGAAFRIALHDLAARRDPAPLAVPAPQAELQGEVFSFLHVAMQGLLGPGPVVGVQEVGPALVLRGKSAGLVAQHREPAGVVVGLLGPRVVLPDPAARRGQGQGQPLLALPHAPLQPLLADDVQPGKGEQRHQRRDDGDERPEIPR